MSSSNKSVLILGAGLCSPPLVRYLDEQGYNVTIANRTLAAAQKLADGKKNTKAIALDVEKPEGEKTLDEIAPNYDAIVSMLPYLFHPIAAKYAVKHKKHFFTTSYVSDAMKAFDEDAKKAGVIIINECGVDPGTDHMSAMRVIDEVHKKGGKITSFTSYCGGLPAPSCNDNPFGYKLSWAPRGVLLASRNDAHFLKEGKDVQIPGKDLFDNYHVEEMEGVGKLEAYPNRDSTKYIDIYGIKDTATMIRGTYRYPGWCRTIKKLADMGYLDVTEQPLAGLSYAELAAKRINSASVPASLRTAVAEFLKLEANDTILSNMEWLGLFNTEKKVPANVNTFLDALCALCKEKWVYGPGQVDMLVMRHTFKAVFPDGSQKHITSTMVDYGIPNGETSMSRTVSLPVAIAIKLVFEGKIKLTGLQIPIIPEIYNPILNELESIGIKFVEKEESA